jgi:hypothetical protein
VREGTNAEGVEAGGGEHEAEIHEEGVWYLWSTKEGVQRAIMLRCQ